MLFVAPLSEAEIAENVAVAERWADENAEALAAAFAVREVRQKRLAAEIAEREAMLSAMEAV